MFQRIARVHDNFISNISGRKFLPCRHMYRERPLYFHPIYKTVQALLKLKTLNKVKFLTSGCPVKCKFYQGNVRVTHIKDPLFVELQKD